MALQYFKRNGYLYSFKSVSLLEGAELFKGLSAISVNPTVEGRDLFYGSGTKAYGRPRGHLMVEVSATFVAEAFFDIVAKHPTILDEEFNLSVVFEEGPRRDVIDLVSLTFEGIDKSAEGTEATTVELSGTAIDCLINKRSVMGGDALGMRGDAGAQ